MQQVNEYTKSLIDSLQRDRDSYYTKVKEYDKMIKALKVGDFSLFQAISDFSTIQPKNEVILSNNTDTDSKEFPLKTDTKIQILYILDKLAKASKLRLIQDEYNALTNTKGISIRESMRTLHKAGKVLLMKEKSASRGICWVKAEWVENGVLLPQYKFNGFDLMYKDEDMEYTQREVE